MTAEPGQKRRRIILLWAAAVAAAALAWMLLGRNAIDRTRVYRIGYGNDGPFHFQGPDGSPTGLAVEIVAEAARRAGIKLQWVQTRGFSGAELWVLHTILPERRQRQHITEPYLQSESWFVVPAESRIRKPQDLATARISYMDYGIHRVNLTRLLPGMQPVPVQSSREALTRLAEGHADAAFINEYAVLPALLEGGLSVPMRIIPSEAPKGLMGIGAPFAFAPVADVIRNEIATLVDDGTIATIARRWGLFPNLTENLVKELVSAQHRSQRLLASLVGLLVVLCAALWLAFRSRRQTIQLQQAATALQEGEARFRALVENAPEAIVVLDCERGVFADFNDKACRLFQLSREEMLATGPVALSPALQPDGRPSAESAAERIRQALDGASPRFEWTHRNARGTVIPCEIHLSRLPSSRGVLVRGSIVDITERLHIEEQLRRAQKMEAIGQLTGGLAHDFNNILAAMLLSLEMLQQDRRLDPATIDALQELETEAKRAAGLTRQLLMFGRQSVMELRIHDLNEIVANLLKMLGRLLGEDITLVFERRSALPGVNADAGMLEQVMVNLAVNARDAMPRGGRITLATETVELTPEQVQASPDRRAGRFVCLSVADTGTGMDAATLRRIFEPFFTTKEAGKGTGLGLASVYGIAAQHNGWVEVESTPGQGSTFRLFIPAATAQATGARRPESEPHSGGHETLLIVEDDDGVRQMLAKVLGFLGYRVLEADNGPAALQIWREHHAQINLLITDMVMPGGMTGLELAERVRIDKPGLKIIVSSGYNAEMVQRGTLSTDGILYLPKPYDLSQLGAILRSCLDHR